jgi:uncharacterized membrane protein YfcA
MIDHPLFYLAAVPAVTLLGLAKGGFSGLGLMSLPLMALVVSPVQSAAILLPILIVQDAVSVWSYRKTWDRTNLKVMLPGAAIGILLGYLLAARVSDTAVGFALGVISVIFAARRLIAERRGTLPAPTKASWGGGTIWGIVMGFVSMIAHAGGPPFQIYVMPQRLQRDIFVGTGAVAFAIINLIKVPPYLALGQFTRENLMTSLVLVPVAILSTFAGVWLVRRVSGEKFYTAVYILLVIVGFKLIIDGIMHLDALMPVPA